MEHHSPLIVSALLESLGQSSSGIESFGFSLELLPDLPGEILVQPETSQQECNVVVESSRLTCLR